MKPGLGRRRLLAGALASIAFAALAAALWITQPTGSRGQWDEREFHLPVIRQFAAQWPAPDLADYDSATTPLYHLILAAFSELASPDLGVLRFVGSVFALALLFFVGVVAARAMSWHAAVCVTLPLAWSLYIVSAGVWLLPDNAAWLAVAALLALALRPRADALLYVAGGGLLLWLVLVRQSHLWAAGVLWAAAWLGGRGATVGELLRDWRQRVPRLLLALAATLPAVAAFALLARQWGGLVPPSFQDRLQGGNPAVPGSVLLLLGGFSVFYSDFLRIGIRRLAARERIALGVVAVGLTAGALVGTLPSSDFNIDAGRYSGFWNLVRAGPVVASRSPIFVGGSILGGIAAALWFLSLGERDRWIWLAALVGFIAAMSTSTLAWQRYFEPMALLLMILGAVSVSARGEAERGAASLFAWLGPLLLGLAQLALTSVKLWS